MERRRFRAMGTDVDVRATSVRRADATSQLFETIEQLASRFRPDSELSHLNRATAREVVVSSALAEVLRIAAEMRCRTDGLVDAGLGSTLARWGYDRTFEATIGPSREPDQLAHGSWGVEGRAVWRDLGVTLDLGGVAKGWTCDLAVDSGLAFVVSAGGDVRSGDPDTMVEVVDPWNHVVASVPLGVGALATSSVTRRAWKAGASDAHHIIDPRTNRPAVTPVVSATVVTDRAVDAEAGAKAVLLHGASGLAWAAEQSWIHGALTVWHDGSVYATPDLEVAA